MVAPAPSWCLTVIWPNFESDPTDEGGPQGGASNGAIIGSGTVLSDVPC